MRPATRRFLANLPGIVAVTTLPLAALAYLFVGGTAAGAIAVVGWLFLVPITAILGEEVFELDEAGADVDADGDASTETADPLATLRDRYARGEIGEAEFERRVERLLETEDVETAAETWGGRAADVELERE